MIFDVNVNLSRWPFRRLPYDETPKLVAKLRKNKIVGALAGSFDALLHKDVADVNARLVAECKQYGDGILTPVGTVNPTLPDWREDVRRCQEDYGMQVIRLHPNYHGYKLDDTVSEELFALADDRSLVVQIAMKMEDVRTHHPLVQVPTVDASPLAKLVSKHPKLRVIVMNNYKSLRGETLSRMTKAGQVYFEISHAEQVGALDKLIKLVPYERLLFGSHFPFFYLEAALLKFRESDLGQFVTEAIQYKNAQQLLNIRLQS